MWAVVPAKRLCEAKQRLAGVLSAEERRDLARAMLADVLRCLSGIATIEGILVVSGDPEIAAIARSYGATVAEDESAGHTAAVECGLRVLRAQGANAALVLSADVPGISAAEVECLLAEHARAAAKGPALTIVTDIRRDGTNAVCCSPLDAIRFSFGLGSLERHLSAAHERGVAVTVLDLPGIALDIDEPEDLEALMALETQCHAARYLQEIGAARRLA